MDDEVPAIEPIPMELSDTERVAVLLLEQAAAAPERVEFHTLMDSAIAARNRLLSS